MRINKRNSSLHQIREKLLKFEKSAWIPITQLGDSSITASKYGGIPYLLRDESWPQCGCCGRSMHLCLQLNLDEAPLFYPSDKKNVLQFFSCLNTALIKDALSHLIYLYKNSFSCDLTTLEIDDIACEKGYLSFLSSSLVRVVEVSTDPNNRLSFPDDMKIQLQPRTIVNWIEVDDYPSLFEMESMEIIDEDEMELLVHFRSSQESYLDLYDKLGGWAEWQSLSPDYPICPICQEKMTNFLFQISSEVNIDYRWLDCGNAYIFQCPEHFDVVTAALQG